MAHTFAMSVLAQVRIHVPASPDTVWQSLVTDAGLVRLFGADELVCDWRPAAPIVMRGYVKARRFEDRGQIIAIQPGQRLRFGHWSQLSGLPNSPENYTLITLNLSAGESDEGADGTWLSLSKSLWLGKPAEVEPDTTTELTWIAVLTQLAHDLTPAPTSA